MFVVLYTSVFLVLFLATGVLFSFFTQQRKVLLSELLFNAGLGLAVVIPVLLLLNIFVPLSLILNQISYFLYLGIALYYITKLQLKMDALGLAALGVFLVFTLFFHQLEVKKNYALSFGGNGDFFNQVRILQLSRNYALAERMTVNGPYKQAQWRIQEYGYPLGASTLLSFFGSAVNALRPFSELSQVTFHKTLMSLAAMLCVIVLYRWKPKVLLAISGTFFVFSLPLLNSVIGMDFIPQEGAYFAFLLLLGLLLKKDYSYRLPLVLLLNSLVYYYTLFFALPLIAYALWQTWLHRKGVFYLTILILITSLLYYSHNAQSVMEETQLGSLTQPFQLSQLLSVGTILYNPAFESIELMPHPQQFDFMATRAWYATLIVGFLILGLRGKELILARKYQQLRFRRITGSQLAILSFAVLSVGSGFWFYFFKGNEPYYSYKIFSLITVLYGFAVVFVLNQIYLLNRRRKLMASLSCLALSFLIGVNAYLSLPYHDNWLRQSNAELITQPSFKEAVKQLTDGTVFVHRNVHFQTLLSVFTFPKMQFFSNGFYFDTYAQAYRDEPSEGLFCDLGNYNSEVSKVIIEEGACENGLPASFPYHNNFAGNLQIYTLR